MLAINCSLSFNCLHMWENIWNVIENRHFVLMTLKGPPFIVGVIPSSEDLHVLLRFFFLFLFFVFVSRCKNSQNIKDFTYSIKFSFIFLQHVIIDIIYLFYVMVNLYYSLLSENMFWKYWNFSYTSTYIIKCSLNLWNFFATILKVFFIKEFFYCNIWALHAYHSVPFVS